MADTILCAGPDHTLLYAEGRICITEVRKDKASFIFLGAMPDIKQILANRYFFVILTEAGKVLVDSVTNRDSGRVRTIYQGDSDQVIKITLGGRCTPARDFQTVYLLTKSGKWFSLELQRDDENITQTRNGYEKKWKLSPDDRLIDVWADEFGSTQTLLTNTQLLVRESDGYKDLGIRKLYDAYEGSPLVMVAGLPVAVEKIKQSILGYSYTFLLTVDGKLYASGSAYDKRFLHSRSFIPIAADKGRVFQVGASSTHMVILTEQGFFAVGENRCGELGLGDKRARYEFERIVTPTIFKQPFTADIADKCRIAVEVQYTAIYLPPGIVFTCGRNTEGRLGYGSTELGGWSGRCNIGLKDYCYFAAAYYLGDKAFNSRDSLGLDNFHGLISSICSWQQKVTNFYRSLFVQKKQIEESACADLIKETEEIIASAAKKCDWYQPNYLNAVRWLLAFIYCTAKIEDRLKLSPMLGFSPKVILLNDMSTKLKFARLQEPTVTFYMQHICFLKYQHYRKLVKQALASDILPDLREDLILSNPSFYFAQLKQRIVLSVEPSIILFPANEIPVSTQPAVVQTAQAAVRVAQVEFQRLAVQTDTVTDLALQQAQEKLRDAADKCSILSYPFLQQIPPLPGRLLHQEGCFASLPYELVQEIASYGDLKKTTIKSVLPSLSGALERGVRLQVLFAVREKISALLRDYDLVQAQIAEKEAQSPRVTPEYTKGKQNIEQRLLSIMHIAILGRDDIIDDWIKQTLRIEGWLQQNAQPSQKDEVTALMQEINQIQAQIQAGNLTAGFLQRREQAQTKVLHVVMAAQKAQLMALQQQRSEQESLILQVLPAPQQQEIEKLRMQRSKIERQIEELANMPMLLRPTITLSGEPRFEFLFDLTAGFDFYAEERPKSLLAGFKHLLAADLMARLVLVLDSPQRATLELFYSALIAKKTPIDSLHAVLRNMQVVSKFSPHAGSYHPMFHDY